MSVAVNCCSSAVSGCQCQCIARLSFPLEANGRIRLSTLVTLSVDASALLYLYFSFLQYRRLNTVVSICTCGFLQFHIGSGSAYYGYPELGYHLKCYNMLVRISIPRTLIIFSDNMIVMSRGTMMVFCVWEPPR